MVMNAYLAVTMSNVSLSLMLVAERAGPFIQ